MDLLSTRRQDYQFNTFTNLLLSYKSIIYKSPDKPNQYIFLTRHPSTNTRSGLKARIETIDIFPTNLPITTYLSISDLDDTIKYIHTDIKAFNDNIHTDVKAMNDHIAYMLSTIIDTSVKTNNQDENIIDIFSKLSTYEDFLDKISNKETQIHTLKLQVKN